MQIQIHGLFHTPESFEEIESWINRHNKDDRIHLYTAAFMTWNLLATCVKEASKIDPTVGSKLKNGATVLGYLAVGEHRVVLANSGPEHAAPYVTWRMDKEGNCFWGHYFRTEMEASDDFFDRARALRFVN